VSKVAIIPGHAVAWVEKIQANIEFFKIAHVDMTKLEKLDYIRQQYQVISLISAALDGRVRFVGAYHNSQQRV
jgi:hypothetical protein